MIQWIERMQLTMNAITRWDPMKEMEDLQNRLSNLFGRTPARLGDGKEESITVAEWAPRRWPSIAAIRFARMTTTDE